MMLSVTLHPEVIKFLEETGTVYFDSMGIKSYIVNNSCYTETDVKGIYTIQFIKE